MIIGVEELRALGMAAFEKAEISQKIAQSVVDALVFAELEGLPSHGFSRIPFYIAQALSGKVKKNPQIKIENPLPASILVNADNGFAFPAIEEGLKTALPQVKKTGIVGMGIKNSHHCGVLGKYAEQISKEGLLVLIFSNTPAAMAPWGGSKASFGTNPIAFGCPNGTDNPLVIDLSLSKVARGKVMSAKLKGESIPEGWALDENGKPTTNPELALKGTMIPMGDAKGSALALMVELLTAALTGSNYAFEASSFFEASGRPPAIAQFFIIIDPAPFNSDFVEKAKNLFIHIVGQDGARLPGSRRNAIKNDKLREGIEIPDKLYADLSSGAF